MYGDNARQITRKGMASATSLVRLLFSNVRDKYSQYYLSAAIILSIASATSTGFVALR